MGLFSNLVAGALGRSKEAPEERKKRIVGDYINRCSRLSERTVVDIRELPHPKGEIQEAMLWLMQDQASARAVLPGIFVWTARYQPGVGQRDLLAVMDDIEAEVKQLEGKLGSIGIKYSALSG